jgi:hypothetical protein
LEGKLKVDLSSRKKELDKREQISGSSCVFW